MNTVFLRVVLALCIALSMSCVATTGQADPLPTAVGSHLRLGMSVEEFVQIAGIRPSRCASCTDGALLAQVEGALVEEVGVAVQEYSLKFGREPRVECYFASDKMKSIVVSGLKSQGAKARMTALYGKGRTIQSTADDLEIEWVKAGHWVRLSRLDGEYSVMLAVDPG